MTEPTPLYAIDFTLPALLAHPAVRDTLPRLLAQLAFETYAVEHDLALDVTLDLKVRLRTTRAAGVARVELYPADAVLPEERAPKAPTGDAQEGTGC